MLAALVPSVGSKVEDVPYMGGPHPRTLLDHLQHVLMVDALVALGIVALFGSKRLVLRVGVCAVLAQADAPVWELGVVLVKEFVVLLQVAYIPAKIQVVAVHIRNLQKRTVDVQHEYICHGGGTGGVQLVAQIIQRPVVFYQGIIDGAGGSDFVAQAPDGDGRVVIALDDQLFHLGKSVGPAVFHVHGDIGDLGPDDDAVFVAQVVKFLGMLVVGQAQGVGPQLPDDLHILLVVLAGQSVAHALAVLVPGATPEGVASAVQNEALLRIDLVVPAAKAGGDAVAAGQGGRGGVQVGIVHTVPQMDILNGEFRLGVTIHAGDGFALPVHGDGHLFPVLPGFHGEGCGFRFQVYNGGDLDA